MNNKTKLRKPPTVHYVCGSERVVCLRARLAQYLILDTSPYSNNVHMLLVFRKTKSICLQLFSPAIKRANICVGLLWQQDQVTCQKTCSITYPPFLVPLQRVTHQM